MGRRIVASKSAWKYQKPFWMFEASQGTCRKRWHSFDSLANGSASETCWDRTTRVTMLRYGVNNAYTVMVLVAALDVPLGFGALGMMTGNTWFLKNGEDLLGPSLEDLLNFCKGRLSLKTAWDLRGWKGRLLGWKCLYLIFLLLLYFAHNQEEDWLEPRISYLKGTLEILVFQESQPALVQHVDGSDLIQGADDCWPNDKSHETRRSSWLLQLGKRFEKKNQEPKDLCATEASQKIKKDLFY